MAADGNDARQQVTIYDIAREAGVSPSTVSRALSKPGRLSARTEFRVRQVAERMGYLTVDAESRSSRTRATGMIGAIVPDCRNPFYASILHHLRAALDDRGYGLLIFDSAGEHAASRRSIATMSGIVDGLVFLSSTTSEPDLRRVTMTKPVVMVNRTITGISSVTADPRDAIDAAVRRLRETGHRTISYLAGNANTWSSETRRRLIRTAAYRYDLTTRTVRGFDVTVDGGRQAFARYLARPTDAVFAYNDRLAIGFIAAARDSGMRVPEDVSVIGFDDIEEAAALATPLSTIDQHADTLGRRAAEALLDQLVSERPRTVSVMEPATFVDRRSIAPTKRSTMRLGPYVDLKARDADTVTLTMLSSQFNETMPRIEAFMRTHPHIAIDPIEGHTQEQTNALYWERLTSGRSVPDLFNVQRDMMPQFAAADALLDIGTERVERVWGPEYDQAVWKASHYAGGLYGMPGDFGQTVMFYRSDILDRYGLTVPTTWDEFYEEGVRLHRRNPNRWMGVIDVTDPQHYLSFLRMARAKPWSVTGADSVEFHLDNPLVRDTVAFIQQCLDDGVLRADRLWDGRYATPADGTYATIVYANWFGKILASSYPRSAGLWKVTLPPSFSDPSSVCTAEIGGSMLAISARIPRERQRVALEFAHWFQAAPESVDLRPLGGFSATRYFSDDPRLQTVEDPYFGQRIYQTYVRSAGLVNRDWDTLPFATHLSALYRDDLVPALVPGGGSSAVIDAWTRDLPRYAASQGFAVR